MHIACKGTNKTIQIHKTLLVEYVPDLEIRRNDTNKTWSAHSGARYEALETFVRWLYTGKISGLQDGISEDWHFFDAHALGRKVGCVDFMDAILDAIIREVNFDRAYLTTDEVLNAFSAEFPPDSAGRKFSVDFVFHISGLGSDVRDESIYTELSRVEDAGLIAELARKVSAFTGLKLSEDLDKNLQINKMLISGFVDGKEHGNDLEEDMCDKIDTFPWTANECQYHHHTEVGLPCYKKKH